MPDQAAALRTVATYANGRWLVSEATLTSYPEADTADWLFALHSSPSDNYEVAATWFL